MRKFIFHNSKWLVPVLIFVIILVVVITMLYSAKFDAEIIDYRTREDYIQYLNPNGFDYSGEYYYHMSEATINEILEYPHKYTAYSIEVDIQNKSNNAIYDLGVNLQKRYTNLWVENIISESRLDIEAKEETKVYIKMIVRTEGMTETEIDQLIKSVGIKIRASNFRFLSFYSSKTIYFEE